MTIAEIIQEVKDAFDMSLIEQYDGFIAVQVKELRKTMTVKQVAQALNVSERTVHYLSKI